MPRAGAPHQSPGPSIGAWSSGASPAHHPGTSGPPRDPPLSPCLLCPPSPENTWVSNVTGASGAPGFVCGKRALASAEYSAAKLPAVLMAPLLLSLSVSTHCSVSHLRVLFHCSFICPFYLLPGGAKALVGSDAVALT